MSEPVAVKSAARASRRSRGTPWMRGARLVHRWLGFALVVWVSAGTATALPGVAQSEGTSGLAAVAGVFRLEAEGGGPINHPATLTLITAVAALGVALFVHRLVGSRRRTVPRSTDAWLRLVHRWLGAAFTVSLVAYLAARIALGSAPVVLGWTWLLLVFAVNILGLVLFAIHVVRRVRRRGRRSEQVVTKG